MENQATTQLIEMLTATIEQLQKNQKAKPAKNADYLFTEKELKAYTKMVLEKGAEVALDSLRSTCIDDGHGAMEVGFNEYETNTFTILAEVDTDALADDIEEEISSDWEDMIKHNMHVWYNASI